MPTREHSCALLVDDTIPFYRGSPVSTPILATRNATSSDDSNLFAQKSAFLLNANARAVSRHMVNRLKEVIPHGDLFLSRTLDEAQTCMRTIVRRGYARVFTGGGDGTLMNAITLLRQFSDEMGKPMPEIGVLRLGTGNAMAGSLGAQSPMIDAYHIVNQGPMSTEQVRLIECDGGTLAPMAGIGYEGEVINDYNDLKHSVKNPLAKIVVESVGGYLAAVLFRSAPRHFRDEMPLVRITTRSNAWYMQHTDDGKDQEVLLPAGSVLFEGRAPAISLGAIPYFGFGFTMFPFVTGRPDMMQLRITTTSIPKILTRLFPAVWRGTFRDEKMFDFLVKDVDIQCSTEMAYQEGGDARGSRKSLSFRISEQPITMLKLGARLQPAFDVPLLGPASRAVANLLK